MNSFELFEEREREMAGWLAGSSVGREGKLKKGGESHGKSQVEAAYSMLLYFSP